MKETKTGSIKSDPIGSTIGSTIGFKIVLALLVPLVLTVIGLLIYMENTTRPQGSPPPGYEGRLKYNLEDMPGSANPNQIPIDMWFGKHDGKYDTTQLRIDSDYITLHPHYHGEGFHITLVWPSMLSTREYGRMRKREGMQPEKNRKQFTIILGEIRSDFGRDKKIPKPTRRCEPIIRDEMRGVTYCNVNSYDDAPNERWTYYWPLDNSFRTPLYNNPPMFSCSVTGRLEEKRFGACSIRFAYNDDVYIWMEFVPEQLAIDILTDFPRLIEFLNTLEVKP